MSLRTFGRTVADNTNKGIPANAIRLYLYSCVVLLLAVLAGVAVVVKSDTCYEVGNIYAHYERSWRVYTATIIGEIFAPVCLLVGRCNDFQVPYITVGSTSSSSLPGPTTTLMLPNGAGRNV